MAGEAQTTELCCEVCSSGEGETFGKNSLQGSVEKLAFSPVTLHTLGQFRQTQHSAVMEMFCISILQQRNH